MTIRISVPIFPSSSEAGPSTTFATPSLDPEGNLRCVVSSLRKAKKVVVISGAGVSTGADIPDFRSASGLFNDPYAGKEKGKGKEREGTVSFSTKDLFHVKCLSNPTLLASHHALITSLASLALSANPTPFHSYLSMLDGQERLLRCYTQNIDNLEEKAGLSVGITAVKRGAKSPKKVEKTTTGDSTPQYLSTSPMFDISPPAEGYRAVPLHGLLTNLHCPLCFTVVPLSAHLPLPSTQIPCPTCQLSDTIRSALSERTRRTGFLRPSVVLYGEEHPQGEQIGSVVQKDLKSVEILLVVGTSLSVPGVKRIVKEMAKAARSRKGKVKDTKCRAVFVNDEPPSKGSEWEGVFDFWIQGDVQNFVTDYLGNPAYDTTISPIATGAKTRRATPRTPTKKRNAQEGDMFPPTPESLKKTISRAGQSKAVSWEETGRETPTKKRKTTTATTPPRKPKVGSPLTPVSSEKLVTAKRSKVHREKVSPSPNPVRILDFEGSLTPVSCSDYDE
ncbi:hypothetical protein IAR55_003629 [Kwoniella newhampshirensis]|uniref:Deacetylase sirtuin-type domain-containing protein n=1 Tax=Kwoniella newhampshirensis TaxID=1651941 RepID=A0AAW0YZL7_9TREE